MDEVQKPSNSKRSVENFNNVYVTAMAYMRCGSVVVEICVVIICVMQPDKWLLMFWRDVLPPSSG